MFAGLAELAGLGASPSVYTENIFEIEQHVARTILDD